MLLSEAQPVHLTLPGQLLELPSRTASGDTDKSSKSTASAVSARLKTQESVLLSEAASDAATASFKDMCQNTTEIKEDIRNLLEKPVSRTTSQRYKKTGIWQKLAKHPLFDNITLGVIALNAAWMSIDTDWNKADTLPEADTLFQFMEHAFCTFFSAELFVRFMAFEDKRECLRDGWFVFDGFLVFLMVSETWVLLVFAAATNTRAVFPLGNAAVLRLLRLLRLSRLLRSVPQLRVLFRAMLTSVKSVLYVGLLLVVCTYIFAILCTQLAVGTSMGQMYFQNVALAMYSLMVYATFLDNLADFCNNIRAESVPVLFIVLLYISIACLTLLNMLLGVLCEVISEVAETEHFEMKRKSVSDKLWSVATALDENGNGRISAKEFEELFHDADALQALVNVGVDPEGVVDISQVMFYKEDGTEIDLPFDDFMDQVFELRDENSAKLRDVKRLWTRITPQLDRMLDNVANLKGKLRHIEDQALSALAIVRTLAQTVC